MHKICTCGKPLMQKSANFMPSRTILETFQISPIYIFVKEYFSPCFFVLLFKLWLKLKQKCGHTESAAS